VFKRSFTRDRLAGGELREGKYGEIHPKCFLIKKQGRFSTIILVKILLKKGELPYGKYTKIEPSPFFSFLHLTKAVRSVKIQ